MKTTFWLYYDNKLIASVRGDWSYSDNTVRGIAAAEHERNPTVYSDFPDVAPFTHAAQLRFAEVRRDRGSPRFDGIERTSADLSGPALPAPRPR